MRRTFAPAIAVAIGVAALASARTARADGPTPARVRVDAPADCVTEPSFWSALARRTDRLRAAEASDAEAATIDVTIRRAGPRVRGELRVARAGERPSTRSLGGVSCGEVTDGLSLVAALAFDPAAKLDPGAEAPAGADEAPPPPPPPAPSGAPESPSAEPAAAAAPRRIDRAPAAETRPEATQGPRWRFAAGGTAGALAVAAPGATLAYGGFVEVEVDRAGFAPALRLGIAHAEGTADADTAHADLAWTFARVAACPFRLDASNAISVRPCVTLDAGALRAEPRGAKSLQPRGRPWVAPGAAARIAWAPVRAAFVEGQLGVAAPLVRDELVIDPSLTLYRAPAVAASAEIGAGVRFP